MSRSTVASAVVGAACLLALTGCNGNNSSSGASAAPSGPGNASPGPSASSPGVVPTNTSRIAPAASAALPSHEAFVLREQWTEFFNGKTPYADRVRLLQNGNQFQTYFAQHSQDPNVQHLGAKVTNVQFANAGLAHVTFTLYEGSKPVAQHLSGTALLNQSNWQVSAQTFCSVVTKYGQPKPPVCP